MQHLQSYVAAKVHGKHAAYASALSAITTGLQQHEHMQPEVAVFSKVSRARPCSLLVMLMVCKGTEML